MFFSHKLLSLYTLLLLSIQVATAQCTLTATSSGGNAAYTQVYVLVDASGHIVAENATGTFAGVGAGVYHIHALNYNPADAPDPLPAALIGQDVSLVGSTTAGCFNNDFLTDYAVRTCDACLRTETVCETDPLVVSASGFTAGFTQLYVLVNTNTGLVVATNGSGNFTGFLVAGTSYKVYALNYNPTDPPNPLPVVGQPVTAVGSSSAGCYNDDFLTDYLCVNVTPCANTCFKTISVCMGDVFSVRSSGNNSSYSQVYILADETGNCINTNTNGDFSTTGLTLGATYRVHAINYNPSDPPSPLPLALAAGQPLTAISGGCYNAEFKEDFVCVQVDCILMDAETLTLQGQTLNKENKLYWQAFQRETLSYYRLERSTNGFDFETLDIIANDQSYTYHHHDDSPLQHSYYRLVAVSPDGTTKISNVIYLEQQSAEDALFTVFPNPNQGQITVEFSLPTTQNVQLELYDVLGHQLQTMQWQASQGINRSHLSLEQYSSGVYFLVWDSGTTHAVRRLVKL